MCKEYEKKIAIYGAGKFARMSLAQMVSAKREVDSFIVTDMAGNSDALFGIPVKPVSEILHEKDAFQIVIGVSGAFYDEVLEILDRYGFRDVVFPWLRPMNYKDYQWMNHKDYIDLWYFVQTGSEIDWSNLRTFREKMQWFKLYGITDEIRMLSNKLLVRDWVKKKIGEQYLTLLYGVWDSYDEIDFGMLPERYVLKCNHGCGFNYISYGDNTPTVQTKKMFDKWMSADYSYSWGLELQYNGIARKIYAEEYLENKGKDLYDYKFWCFDGKVEFIMFLSSRGTGLKMNNYDKEWNLLPFTYDYQNTDNSIPKPDKLDEMIEIAEVLAEGFSHVRVDLYLLNNGEIKFGEMTFTSAGGAMRFYPEEYDRLLGDRWMLSMDTVR